MINKIMEIPNKESSIQSNVASMALSRSPSSLETKINPEARTTNKLIMNPSSIFFSKEIFMA
jgi:hypothetical protein